MFRLCRQARRGKWAVCSIWPAARVDLSRSGQGQDQAAAARWLASHVALAAIAIVASLKVSDKLPEDERFDLNLTDIAEVWRRGSVISSWLLDLSADALAQDQMLETYSGRVADSGEGHWTVEAAMEEAVPVHVLSAALFARYRSRVDGTFGDKLLSALRFGFGGHVEIPR